MFLSRLFSTQDDRLAYSRLRDGVADRQEGHTPEVAAELQAMLAAKRAEQELAEAQKCVEEASAERVRLANAVQALAAETQAKTEEEEKKAKAASLRATQQFPATSGGTSCFDREAALAEVEELEKRARAFCELWKAAKEAGDQLQAAKKRLAEAQRAKEECDAIAKQAEHAAWALQAVSLDRKNQ